MAKKLTLSQMQIAMNAAEKEKMTKTTEVSKKKTKQVMNSEDEK